MVIMKICVIVPPKSSLIGWHLEKAAARELLTPDATRARERDMPAFSLRNSALCARSGVSWLPAPWPAS